MSEQKPDKDNPSGDNPKKEEEKFQRHRSQNQILMVNIIIHLFQFKFVRMDKKLSLGP